MKKAKTILCRLLYPPKWVLYTISVFSFGTLIFIFAFNREESLVAYPFFFLSAYSLIILLATLPAFIRRLKQLKSNLLNQSILIKKVSSTTFGSYYLNDNLFRNRVSIYQGMTINFLYMLFRLVTAVKYTSIWFFSMAIYYMVLCIMRAYLGFGYCQKEEKGIYYELRFYRRTAGMLFILNIPMGGMIILMIQTNSSFNYPGYLIYLSALYTFYMIILSVVNLMKFRKMDSPILSAVKILNFVSAMMSVLGLQTAMIARFSLKGENYRKMMNAITGGIIFLMVIVTVAMMMVQSSKKEKRRWSSVKKSESKYFNTALRMDKAFLKILEKKDIEYITVKEICEVAGVNRSTFYLHYETIGDLLAESIQYMNEQFLEHMKLHSEVFISKIHECPLNELYLVTPEYLTPYLEYIVRNKRLFRTALKNSGSLGLDRTYNRMMNHVFIPILERFKLRKQIVNT